MVLLLLFFSTTTTNTYNFDRNFDNKPKKFTPISLHQLQNYMMDIYRFVTTFSTVLHGTDR